jgi:hypothetical protein
MTLNIYYFPPDRHYRIHPFIDIPPNEHLARAIVVGIIEKTKIEK